MRVLPIAHVDDVHFVVGVMHHPRHGSGEGRARLHSIDAIIS